MKIQNKQFNEWLGERDIEWREVREGGVYLGTTTTPFVNHTFTYQVSKDELIGLMTIFLLDNGYSISKEGNDGHVIRIEYYYNTDADLFTCLKTAIESLEGSE
jgi:hypothetical protein